MTYSHLDNETEQKSIYDKVSPNIMTHSVSQFLDDETQRSYSISSKQGKHDIDKLHNKCRVSTKKGLLCPNLGKYNLGECANFCRKHFEESLRRIMILACSDEFQLGFDDHHTETFRPSTSNLSIEFNLKDVTLDDPEPRGLVSCKITPGQRLHAVVTHSPKLHPHSPERLQLVADDFMRTKYDTTNEAINAAVKHVIDRISFKDFDVSCSIRFYNTDLDGRSIRSMVTQMDGDSVDLLHLFKPVEGKPQDLEFMIDYSEYSP